jgi:phosphate transport system protein
MDNPSSQTHFLAELAELRQQLTEEGTAVAARLEHAMRGLTEPDLDLLDEVALGDAEINSRQMALDDRAFKLLALRQPVATDLRVVVAAIKINSELERVGDLAVNIAEAARRYLVTGPLAEQELLPRMFDVAQAMFEESLDAFVSGNLALAQAVLERDDALDSLRAHTFRRLVEVMTDNGARVPPALELMLIAKHLERIGDHATNIAEDVFFVVAGEDVRHQVMGLPIINRTTSPETSPEA